jgi:hypothetical protein
MEYKELKNEFKKMNHETKLYMMLELMIEEDFSYIELSDLYVKYLKGKENESLNIRYAIETFIQKSYVEKKKYAHLPIIAGMEYLGELGRVMLNPGSKYSKLSDEDKKEVDKILTDTKEFFDL